MTYLKPQFTTVYINTVTAVATKKETFVWSWPQSNMWPSVQTTNSSFTGKTGGWFNLRWVALVEGPWPIPPPPSHFYHSVELCTQSSNKAWILAVIGWPQSVMQGCHSHRFYSHSCTCGSKLTTLIFSCWLLTLRMQGMRKTKEQNNPSVIWGV